MKGYEKYARLNWELNDQFDPETDFYKSKTNFAVAIISNCRASNNRLKYINELSKYVPVDLYGKCGNKTCPGNNRRDCKQSLAADYKFYLSFENSICRDYITEKFFLTLTFNIIPVVMGGGTYDHYVIINFNFNIFEL